MTQTRSLLAIVGVCLFVAISSAAEVTTNGQGGGDWSDPATWRGKTVPAEGDDVVIQKGDAVVFDRNDDGKTTCQKLYLDPKSSLTFKTNDGKKILCVADAVESYGLIKIDGSKAAADLMEVRFIGDAAAKRSLKLQKGGALIVSGRADLPGDKRNVLLTSPVPVGEKKEPITAILEAGAGTRLDLQRAELAHVVVKADHIDNTGAKANEQLNIIDNHFTGLGRVQCEECDTPLIGRNRFENSAEKPLDSPAIHITRCPLAAVRGNVVKGGFRNGIYGIFNQDGTVVGNTVENCPVGLHWAHSQNLMLKNLTVKSCPAAMEFYNTTGVVEESTLDGAKTAISNRIGAVQLTSVHVSNPAKDGTAVWVAEGGSLTLLNCNVTAAQVVFVKPVGKSDKIPVTAMNYLIVKAKDAPEGAEVDVRTNPLPVLAPGAADLNVRNAPAELTNGLTPLPQSLAPVIVKAWVVDLEGKTIVAPEYTVRLLERAATAGGERKVLRSVNVKPLDSWYRPKPNEGEATVELKLK